MPDLAQYIGKPFKYGGRGPEFYDCYGLVKAILKEEGAEIPDYMSPDDGPKISALVRAVLPFWEECEIKKGCVLLFKVPGNMHVGYYMGNGKFIHAWEGSNMVIIEPLSVWRKRLVGSYEYTGS